LILFWILKDVVFASTRFPECWARRAQIQSKKGGGVSLVAQIARDECKKLYEKGLAGLEEELSALYKTIEEYTHRI
jgi:hypothetical protein